MRSFFVIAMKDGRRLEADAVEAARGLIRSTIRFRGHVTGEDAVITPHWCLLAFTNTPWAPLERTPDTAVAVNGFVGPAFPAARLRADLDLAATISEMPGRFSAAVAEPAAERLAIATPAARVDSVFVAENRDAMILGTQASVVSRLMNRGELRYAPAALYSFINTGFYGSDSTPFEGVRALPPLKTVLIAGSRIQQRALGLWELRRAGSLSDHVEACSAAFVEALSLAGDSTETIKLGLSGGKDSRLILAGLLAAGVKPECFTHDRGTSNHADVWVATQIARMTGVEHEIRPAAVTSQAGQDTQRVDLLARAAKVLHATDGMIYAHDNVYGWPDFRPGLTVAGLGGEMLRGGYAEYARDATDEDLQRRAHKQFGAFAQYFTPEATAAYREELDNWLATYRSYVPAPDALEFLYVYFRMGRWVAAGSGGSMTKLAPLADNGFSRAVLGVGVTPKARHELSLEMLRALHPELAEFPLAGKYYALTPLPARAELRARYPDAYAKPVPVKGRSIDWRVQLHPVLVDHVREYCIDDGRLDLLAGVVDPDAVAGFFDEGEAHKPGNRKFLFGLYSACVLLSENWQKVGPTNRLDVPLDIPDPEPAAGPPAEMTPAGQDA